MTTRKSLFIFSLLVVGSLTVITSCDSLKQVAPSMGEIPGLDESPVNVNDAVAVGSDIAKAASLSDEEVVELARGAAQTLDSQNEIAPPNSSYARRLNKIVAGFNEYDGLQLNYKVYLTEEINAFALADGSIRVYSGLLDLMTDDEVMSVIGHEIGHVKLGHRKKRMQRAFLASGATKAAGSAAGSTTGSLGAEVGAEVLGSLASDVITAQFSQDDETQSDEYGAVLLKESGRDTLASVRALKKLAGDSEGEDSDMFAQFVSSHPQSEERVEHLQGFVADLGALTPIQMAEAKAIRQQAAHSQGAQQPIQPEAVQPEALAESNETDTQMAFSGTEQTVEDQQPTFIASGVEAPQQIEIPAPPIRRPSTNAATVTASPSQRKVEQISPSQARVGDWYIQVGVFKSSIQADALSNAYTQRGENVLVKDAMVDGINYTRVLIGPYRSLGAASGDLARVSSLGLSTQPPFYRKLVD